MRGINGQNILRETLLRLINEKGESSILLLVCIVPYCTAFYVAEAGFPKCGATGAVPWPWRTRGPSDGDGQQRRAAAVALKYTAARTHTDTEEPTATARVSKTAALAVFKFIETGPANRPYRAVSRRARFCRYT